MVIVGNTIRLDIQNRREEIEVTKLVGGSDAFVRRPFLYSGVWYGLGGALIAWVIDGHRDWRYCASRSAGSPVCTAAASGSRGARPATLACCWSLTGVVLGWLGSYVAATRHLRRHRADLISRPPLPAGHESLSCATGRHADCYGSTG